MRKPDFLPDNPLLGLTVAILMAGVVLVVGSGLLWVVPHPFETAGTDYWQHLQYWAAWRFDVFFPVLAEMGGTYQLLLDRINLAYPSWWLSGRFDLAAILALGIGGWIGFLAAVDRSAITHIVGRQLWRGALARRLVKQRSQGECLTGGKGLAMHPSFDWQLALDRENRHFLVLGSVGSGKTVVITPLLQAAIARGDKVVVYDNKGDFTRWFPNGVLFAPWDRRSWVWDIGKDCTNKQDALELAARLIPEGQDPLWHTAARQILVAIILRLQRYKAGHWGWKELYQQACLPREELLAIIDAELPEARHVIAAPEKTSQSILVNFGAHLTLLADLAAAWGDLPMKRRFSLRAWLDDDQTPQRVLILQGSGQYAQLARSTIQSMMTVMAGHINSPSFTESQTRRVWFFLDEFPQLGKLEGVAPLLEIGRSKGIRVVLGAQDFEQIKALYGDSTAKSWMSMAGTQIILRINPGDTANFLAKEVVGYRTIDRTILEDGKRRFVREDVLVVEPSELEADLGKSRHGVTGLLLGFGDVFMLHWPFNHLPPQRPATVPAAWLKTSQSDKPPPLVTAGHVDVVSNESPAATDGSVRVASSASQPKKQRLVLRAPTDELFAMACSGSAIEEAAEPFEALERTFPPRGEA